MKWLHWALLAAGGGCFVFLTLHAGVGHLWHAGSDLGWGVAAIIAIEGLSEILHMLAWQLCFGHGHEPRWYRLWGPHMAAGAINFATPTATIGGELVRASLVPATVPATEAMASITINKLTSALADGGLALGGLAVILARAPLGAGMRLAVIAVAVLFTAGVLGFLWVQRNARAASLVGGHPLVKRLVGSLLAERMSRGAAEVDRRVGEFHAQRGAALMGSIALHVAGTAGGAVQLALFFYLVGLPTDIGTITWVFLITTGLDLAAFFVPAKLGAQEGARMLAMSLMGLDSALGLLFSLVLRIEQIVWAGVGLAAYAVLATTRARGGAEAHP